MAELISWFATAATIVAATITASNLGARITGFGFVIFLFGSIAWFTAGALTGQPALIWTNAVLTLLNVWGIWRWLGRQTQIEEGARTAQTVSEESPGEAIFPASLLTHASLTDCHGRNIAHSVDAMIGSRTGRIHYLIASTGGVAGLGEQLRRIDWCPIDCEGNNIRLPITEDYFARLPVVPRDEWPDR
jgi:hypothetical protein